MENDLKTAENTNSVCFCGGQFVLCPRCVPLEIEGQEYESSEYICAECKKHKSDND